MVDTDTAAASDEPRGGILWPTVAAAIALIVLFSLGTWQLQRKVWKEDLIAKIGARAHADPAPIETVAARIQAGEDLEYTRVRVRGRFDYEKALFLFAPVSGAPGWHVYMPLRSSAGPWVLINRGFVSNEEKNLLAKPSEPQEIDVVGLIRGAEQRTTFTPDNDAVRNLWYWRDLTAMTRASGLEGKPIYPFFVDADAPTAPVQEHEPRGGTTRVTLSNRHLEYAVTWYGLGLTLIGVYTAFVWQRLRGRRQVGR